MIKYLASVLFAVTVHELAHLLTMRLLGIKAGKFSLGFFGVGIEAKYALCSSIKRSAVSFSGSAANIILSVLLSPYAELSTASLAYGVFNLLPHSALDGGELVSLTLTSLGLSDEKCLCVSRFIDLTFTVLLWAVSVYLALNGAGEGLLVSTLYMLFSTHCSSRY